MDHQNIVELVSEFERRIESLAFNDIITHSLQFAAERLELGRVSVALVVPENEGFLMYDATVEIRGIESGRRIPFESASLAVTVRENRSVYREDIRQWAPQNDVDNALIARGFLSTLSIPLHAGGRTIGTLNFASNQVNGIDVSTRQVLELIAPRLALAIEIGKAVESATVNEARLRDIFDSIGEGIAVVDLKTRQIASANPAFCSLIGIPKERPVRCSIDDLHYPEDLEKVLAIFGSMAQGECEHVLDVPYRRGDGTKIALDISARTLAFANKPCVVGVFRDSVQRRKREAEQIQLQKLESIQTLAGGLAHDINNLLTGLVGNVSLVQEIIEPTDEAQSLLDEAQAAARRIATLTRQLITFSKGGAPVRRTTNMIEVLKQALQESSRAVNVTFEMEVPTAELFVFGDSGLLIQVFQNIFRNSIEAMPNGGKIVVRLERQLCNDRDDVCIDVCDEGVGIPSDQLDKVFLPFFTTKNRGSGLGLAVAYSVLINHGGKINVSSNLGQGTTVRVVLPLASNTSDRPISVLEHSSTGERVLVMDDESAVLQIVSRALTKAGYEPTSTISGDEAVVAYRSALEQGRPYGITILDLTVRGGMGGKEAAEKILAVNPSARLIVSSGYSDDSTLANFRSHGFCAVLPKPYSVVQLIDVVTEVLSHR
jgi:PAS domain S-box-containing protein